MTRKIARTREDVREAILREATRQFGEHGFGGVALRDIAHGCDVPLSTLSSHFPRKLALQEAVFQRAVEITIRRDMTANLCGRHPKQQFRQYLVNITELFLNNLPEMQVLDREFQELNKPSTIARLVRISRDQSVMDSVAFIADFTNGTNSEILKSIPAKPLTHMIFAAIYGIVKLRGLDGRVVAGEGLSKSALIRDIVTMFERTLEI